METFTEPRPEALEWLSPAKRSRRLRDGVGWGLPAGTQHVRHRNYLSGQLWSQLWTQFLNPLSTFVPLYAIFAGLLSLGQ